MESDLASIVSQPGKTNEVRKTNEFERSARSFRTLHDSFLKTLYKVGSGTVVPNHGNTHHLTDDAAGQMREPEDWDNPSSGIYG